MSELTKILAPLIADCLMTSEADEVLGEILDAVEAAIAVCEPVAKALGIPPDADLKPFHVIGRTDGESSDGEYTWNTCDGPDDWTVPEACDWFDEPTVYYIDSYLRIGHVERTFGETPVDNEDELSHDEQMALLGIRKVR